MTEADKQQLLHTIAQRITIAEERGLRATAKSWRETYRVITDRPAGEMVRSNGMSGRKNAPAPLA